MDGRPMLATLTKRADFLAASRAGRAGTPGFLLQARKRRENEADPTLVRVGFTSSRKQIANSLAQGLGIPKAEAFSLLERANIAPQRRAETFTLEEWAELWRVFQAEKER